MIGLVALAEDIYTYPQYRPAVAIYSRAPAAEGRPLPCFGGPGTGGVATLYHVQSGKGYRPFEILDAEIPAPPSRFTPYVDLMKEVKAGFGRTLSHLPAVFGVSRQSLYNWLSGEVPKESHQEKIVQLAAAARVFTQTGFKPTPMALDRVIAQGKSFMELLGEGGNGTEAAQKLVRVVKRGTSAREELDALLGDRRPMPLEVSDVGRQSFNEDA